MSRDLNPRPRPIRAARMSVELIKHLLQNTKLSDSPDARHSCPRLGLESDLSDLRVPMINPCHGCSKGA